MAIHGRHVGKYENNKAMPNAETIIRIAKALKVSIDYLLLNDLDENTPPTVILKDSDLIRKFEAVEKMNEDGRHVVISLIDAYIKKQQMETVLSNKGRKINANSLSIWLYNKNKSREHHL